MRILILSENYLNGGMETHIETLIRNMPKDEFFIVTTNTHESIKKKNIFKGLKYIDFNNKDIKIILMEIQKSIYKNKIDIIHAHTYKTYFIAAVLGYRLKIPYIYTIHGPSTIKGVEREMGIDIFKRCLNNANKVITVSNEVDDLLKNLGYDKSDILNNPIDLNLFKKSNLIFSKGKWAIVSRLDFDKTFGIKQCLIDIKDSNIKSIDIFGDGNGRLELEEWVKANRLSASIYFKGDSININKDLDEGKYEGVFAMGRAALEALAKDIPVILLGYFGANCLISETFFNIILSANFSGRNMPVLNSNEIAMLVSIVEKYREKYKLRYLVEEKCDISKLVKKYNTILKKKAKNIELEDINEKIIQEEAINLKEIKNYF